MTTPDPRTAIRRAATALVARAEKRAQTCGGPSHEYVTRAEYEALKAALAWDKAGRRG
jgi:DNA-binding LacI/PurR family transcriptional regulator